MGVLQDIHATRKGPLDACGAFVLEVKLLHDWGNRVEMYEYFSG